MDELGFNKIAGAILATALGFIGLKEISHAVIHVSAPEIPAYALEIAVEDPGAAPDVPLPFPQPEWIAAMDATKGEKVFKKCASCHNADEGGANGTGPNLWNILGQGAAAKASFGSYSSTLKNSGVTWNYEELDGFLKRPSKYMSGTAMNFIGLKKETDRAAVIEYLRQQAPTPLARPEAAIVEAALDAVTDAAELTEESVPTDTATDIADAVENVVTDTTEPLPAEDTDQTEPVPAPEDEQDAEVVEAPDNQADNQ